MKYKSKRDKKVFFSISDKLGGTEQLIFQLMSCQPNHSEVCFFGHKTTNIWEKSGLKVHYCNNQIIELYNFCRQEHYHMIFSSHIMMNATLGLFRAFGILQTSILVCRESTSVFGRYAGLKLIKYKLAYFLGYRKIDLLITQSELMKNVLINNASFLIKRTTLATIPNIFTFPSDDLLCESSKLPSNSIVAAGRLIPEKGFDILIEAFDELLNTHLDMNLVILGEGPEKSNLKKVISRHNIESKVHLLGFVPNVYPYFRDAKICAVSSRKEGFPNVLLQMMSQNDKVVSTLCAGGIESIDGVLTCQPDNQKELAEALNKAITLENKNQRQYFDSELKKRDAKGFLHKIQELTHV